VNLSVSLVFDGFKTPKTLKVKELVFPLGTEAVIDFPDRLQVAYSHLNSVPVVLKLN
jgi:hypothetical protein